jgi:hypothetical protein
MAVAVLHHHPIPVRYHYTIHYTMYDTGPMYSRTCHMYITQLHFSLCTCIVVCVPCRVRPCTVLCVVYSRGRPDINKILDSQNECNINVINYLSINGIASSK